MNAPNVEPSPSPCSKRGKTNSKGEMCHNENNREHRETHSDAGMRDNY